MPEQTREVHVIEVMETVEHDRELELWGNSKDAATSADRWRRRGRRVSHTVEKVRWS